VRDPLAAQLQATLAAAGPDPAQRVAAMLNTTAVFGTDLPHADTFVAAVTDAYALLLAKGARAAAAA
jgi:fructuronate reductase